MAASLLLGHGADALAAPPPPAGSPSATKTPAERQAEAARKREATLLLNQGLVLLRQSEYAEALARFRKAHELFPSAKLLLNIGTSLRYLNRHSEAAATYERYLAAPDAAPDRIPEVERILDGIDHEVAWLVLQPSRRDARVTVDGEAVPLRRDELRVRLDPGSHVVVAEAQGEWLPKVVTLELHAGERRTVPLVLEPKPAPVVVKDGSTQRLAGWTVGGVGVASLGAGGVLGLLARSANASAAEHCATDVLCDAAGAKLGDRASAQALASTVTFAIGGAALTAGLVLVLTAPSGEVPTPRTTPAGTPGITAGSRSARPPSVEAALTPSGARLLLRW